MLVNFGKFSINLDDIILIRYGYLGRGYGVSIEYKANDTSHEFIFPSNSIEDAEKYCNYIMKIYYESKRNTE